ncbi:hypothetical protein ACW5EG_02090 [Luteimonas sp. A611]
MEFYRNTAKDGGYRKDGMSAAAAQASAPSTAPQNEPRYELADLERALRAAHAAGNVDHARQLAQAYVRERDVRAGQGPQAWQGDTIVGGGPTSEPSRANPVMAPAAPKYTEQQLIGALRKADAAGDTPAARAIARRIQSMRLGHAGSLQQSPAEPNTGGDWQHHQTATSASAAGVGFEGGTPPLEPVESDGLGLELDIVGGTPGAAVSQQELQTLRARGAQRSPPIAAETQVRPSLFRMDSDFRERAGVGVPSMLVAAAKDMFGSRQGAAEYLAGKINEDGGLSSLITGGAEVVQDERGDPMLRLPDGTAYRLNDPGLDTTDVGNVAGNVAALWTPAAWAARLGKARNLGLGTRAALQGSVAGTSDAALQAGANGGDVDVGRTALSAVGGAGGEALGTAIGAGTSRLAALARQSSGSNTREAQGMLARLGIQQTAPGRLASLAGGVEEVRAGADPNAILGKELFGFQYTQGQRMADPVRRFDQLSREEVLRQSPGAGGVFSRVSDANRARLGEAVETMGQGMGGQPGANPGALAQSAAGRLQSQAGELGERVSAAYGKAGEGGRAAVALDSVATVPDRMQRAVADFAPTPELTPATARTLAQIRQAVAGAQTEGVKGVTVKAIETQRRILNNNVGAAANPTDRAAMMTLKREFDSWLDEAVEGALVSGDSGALQALKDARRLRFEYGRRFEGKTDADRFIGGLLDGSKTPEELLNVALGAGQVSKAGGARFIERLAQAADNDPQVIGALRAAHFQRLTGGPNGEPLGMGKIVRNVQATEYSNASILKALYSQAEWAEVRRLAAAMEPLVAKGDFARSSGTAERMGRAMFQRLAGGLPIIRDIVSAVADTRALYQANQVLNRPLRLPPHAPPGMQAAGTAIFQEAGR